MSDNSCTTSGCRPITEKPTKIRQHIAIIGSGSGAFSAAIKAAENGATVTIIEGGEIIGGCCVNIGCVPSKILIRAAQLTEQQRNNPFTCLENHTPKLNRAFLAHQQKALVDELRQAKYHKILESNPSLSLVKGYARFKSGFTNTLIISKKNGNKIELSADKTLIATGSSPTIPKIKGLTDTPFWTSTEALFSEQMPKHLIVIGSSVIALEIAQAYQRLGAQVTIISRHTLLYKEDPLLGEELTKIFINEGIIVLTNCQAEHINHNGEYFSLILNDGNILESDKLLISTGRYSNTKQLNLTGVDIATNPNGSILVNDRMQTSQENVYAVGDCTSMPQYVYVAAAAGNRAAINMTGGEANLDLTTMPTVIFTDPQVATVGITENEADKQGILTISRVLTMDNVPRALVNFATDGFIKLVAEKHSGILIGAQILAHEGGELIQSAALAIQNKMTVEELAGQLFPYLTMVEGLKLCAQTFNKDVSELSCCAG